MAIQLVSLGTAPSGTGGDTHRSGIAKINANFNDVTHAANKLVTASGAYWGDRVPVVTASGILEIGKYIDFHNTSADTSDFTYRITDSGSGNLTFSGKVTATTDLEATNNVYTRVGYFTTSTDTASSASDLIFRRNLAAAGAVRALDRLGNIRFYGNDGSTSTQGSIIYSQATEAWTSTTKGCDLQIWITLNGASSGTPVWKFDAVAGAFVPGADNARDVGSSTLRPKQIYSVNSTISTSDAREKTEVTPLTQTEKDCAYALAGEIGWFKWLASIAEKGESNARKHIGLTVQRVIELMVSYGLNPFEYSFVCHDVWEESKTTDDKGNLLTIPAGDRYSLREGELLKFICAGVLDKLTSIEMRLNALEEV